MWMGLRAGAFALATIGAVCFGNVAPAAAQNVLLTEGKISQIKGVLQLSPSQEVHWRSLIAIVRDAAERQPNESASFVQRVKARVGSYVLNAAAMQRIAMAAQPLIASLNEEQRRDGMSAVRAMGVASLF